MIYDSLRVSITTDDLPQNMHLIYPMEVVFLLER